MLGLVEESMLLLLRDEGGSFVRMPTASMRLAIAGAVLTELAGANRIDTDSQHVVLVDDTPTGDRLLDPTLAEQVTRRNLIGLTVAREIVTVRRAVIDSTYPA